VPAVAHQAADASSVNHVIWIGGATDAGKTSCAQGLATRLGLQAYHYDRYDRVDPPGHYARIHPASHPHMHAWLLKSRDEAWVHTTPEDLVAEWLRIAAERFPLSVDDLQALPRTPLVAAEGYGFLPELVTPLLSSPGQAIWLVSTDEFKCASYERRRKRDFFADCSDPARAVHNHIGRDLLIATHIRQSARQLDQTVLEIDGARSLEQVIDLVAAHVESHIRSVGAV
jgi:hypothetical protein